MVNSDDTNEMLTILEVALSSANILTRLYILEHVGACSLWVAEQILGQVHCSLLLNTQAHH